jgi:tetratricopeptide (TPR) repeat protein
MNQEEIKKVLIKLKKDQLLGIGRLLKIPNRNKKRKIEIIEYILENYPINDIKKALNIGIWNRFKRYIITAIIGLIIGGIYFIADVFIDSPINIENFQQTVIYLTPKHLDEKTENPTLEEVKSEFDQEFQFESELQYKEALQLYKRGKNSYANNHYEEAITIFLKALEIVKVPSLYFSTGNSYYAISQFKTSDI